MCKVLDKINPPKDLKVLSRNELVQLCGEIQQQMLLCQISVLLVSIYRLYAFISRELVQRMFLRREYIFFDYNESILLYTNT